MINDGDIVRLVRRHYFWEFFKVAGFAAVLSIGLGWTSGNWETPLSIVIIAVFAIAYIALTKYPPIIKKHRWLLDEYGDVYLLEIDKAIGSKGIGRLINTRWFESYAADFCDRPVRPRKPPIA